MPIKNYTTKVPATQSVAEIVDALAKHGAVKIQQDYELGKPISVAFMIETPTGLRGLKLPICPNKVKAVLSTQNIKVDFNQAERIAWRILRDWVMAQMAILETEMVSIDQVMLPYMTNNQGKTMYELYNERQLQIGDGQQ